ncbi:MAG: hypothetical protein Kow00120_00390 [Anaerolineae bacterium]
MSVPVVVSDGHQLQAVRAQLADWIALQRSDATPQELARMYAVSVTAYRAANLRATVVANVPYRVVDKVSGEPLADHPLNALVRDNVDLPEILERSEITLCFWGHTLVYKRRAQRQRVAALQWINPKLYRARFEAFGGRLVGFDISLNWQGVDYDEQPPEGFITRADALYMHGVDFDNDFDGVAPAENAFDMAGIETEAAQTAVWFLRNRAIPAGLLQPKDSAIDATPPSEADRNAMTRLINRILRGARNAGKTIVTSGRWEWQELQSRFDQVEFRAQHEIAREGVSMAFDVPLDLLLPTAATYAELYQSNKSWVEYFAKNRCKWYARHLTKQLAAEYGDDIRVEPNFADVFQRDDAQVVELVNTKLQGGYLTLYDAQLATGDDKPDERLKDIYIVGGEPVHVERLVTLAVEGRRSGVPWPPEGGGTAPGTSGAPDDGSPPPDGDDTQPPRRSASDAPPGVANATPDPDDWLPDAVFKELRDCVRVTARRGAAYDFAPEALPVDVVAYVRLLVATAGAQPDTEALITAARAYMVSTGDLRAMRAYGDIEARYRATLFDLIRQAFARQIDQATLEARGHAAIDDAYEAAFRQGLADAGAPAIHLSAAETAFVQEQATAERQYWTRLTIEVAERLVRVQEEIEAARQALGQATDPFEQERLRGELLAAKQKLIANRDQVLARLDLWAQALRRLYSQGQLAGERNPMMLWKADHDKENCRTCRALDGQIHRAADFAALELYPGSMALECVFSAGGVPVCGCGMRAVPGSRPRGRLDRVPVFGGVRSLGIAARAEYGEPSGTAVLYLGDAAAVLALQDALIADHPALPDVRWTAAPYLHVTLVHSALVTDDAFADIFSQVTADGVPSFDLHASRLDAFEVGEDHRAIVLLVDDHEALRAFQQRVYDACRARDIPLSEYSVPQAWTPHITLGYERADVGPFAARDVDIAVTTGALAFSRGDYVAQFQAVPGPSDQPESVEV